MRIVSYNINGMQPKSAQSKIEAIIEAMPADVWILAECYEDNIVPEGYLYLWQGSKTGMKGLGVIIKAGLKACKVAVAPQLLNYCIPVSVEGCLIVAMWPTRYEQTKDMAYPQILQDNLLKLEPFLCKQPTVIVGDMNCYVGQSGEKKLCSIKTIYEWLRQKGFLSAYHSTYKEPLGKESKKTLNYRYQGTSFFHIDYIFTNTPIKSFKIADWCGNDWADAPIRSDHAPLSLEI